MNKYDLAVVIGRFQPFHFGHRNLIKSALKTAHKVLVCIGSSDIARNIKNPFTSLERQSMISFEFVNEVAEGRLLFASVRDSMYNDSIWIGQVQKAVDDIAHDHLSVCLVGHKKADTWYLDMFPMWPYVDVEGISNITATMCRDAIFYDHKIPTEWLSSSTVEWLNIWQRENKDIYLNLCEEMSFINQYRAQWAKAPFQPVFVTTDAVVICSGHILLVKRRHSPGKGLWALPGGFLGSDETIANSMLRELDEETRIKVDHKRLLSSVKASKVFDHPNRSERGRTITHAYLLNLGYGALPRVRGSDDAERAKWFKINVFFNTMRSSMYEDHYDIATTMITI